MLQYMHVGSWLSRRIRTERGYLKYQCPSRTRSKVVGAVLGSMYSTLLDSVSVESPEISYIRPMTTHQQTQALKPAKQARCSWLTARSIIPIQTRQRNGTTTGTCASDTAQRGTAHYQRQSQLLCWRPKIRSLSPLGNMKRGHKYLVTCLSGRSVLACIW